MALLDHWFSICISLTLPLLLYILRSRNGATTSSTNGPNLPPGPQPLPLVGNLFTIGSRPYRSLARLAKSHGPVMTIKLGQLTDVVFSSPELAREVLRKKDELFSTRAVPNAAKVLDYHLGAVPWMPASPTWRSFKRIINNHLTTAQKLDDKQAIRRQKAEELVAHLRRRRGEVVDIGQVVFVTMMNMTSNALFSVDLADYHSKASQEFKIAMWSLGDELTGANISDFFPFLGWLDIQGRRRKVEHCLKRLHEIFDQLIDQRLKEAKDGDQLNSTGTRDFLDTLIQFLVHENGSEMDRHTMKNFLVDLLIGGGDSATKPVEWAMAELLRNPAVMEKLRAELATAFDKEKEVDESEILRIPYLQAIVKETFRLHPALPFLVPRRTETSVEVGGFTIPAQTRILVNFFAIGQDESIWENPEVFMPERFLGREVEYLGHEFELLPFGGGRRVCPGMPLATRMVHLTIATLVRSFDWKLPDGMAPGDVDMTEKTGVTFARNVPLRAIPFPIAP